MKITISSFASSNGNNAPFIVNCVGYAQACQRREALGATIKKEFAAILVAEKVTEAKAAKQLAEVLKAALTGAVNSPEKRASEILVALGIRQRAEKAKDEAADASLQAVIDALKALATEQAGEKAIAALRRAYLSLSGEAKASEV